MEAIHPQIVEAIHPQIIMARQGKAQETTT